MFKGFSFSISNTMYAKNSQYKLLYNCHSALQGVQNFKKKKKKNISKCILLYYPHNNY